MGTSAHVAIHHRAFRKERSAGGSVAHSSHSLTQRLVLRVSSHRRERAIRKNRQRQLERAAGASNVEGMALLATARPLGVPSASVDRGESPARERIAGPFEDVPARHFVLQKSVVQSRLREASLKSFVPEFPVRTNGGVGGG